ncbi:MAG TPA: MoaD/ThiS family protein [Gemmatimonas sp.]|uniref:MoaD/ThiS family protein n=1 Tax=Gemmatimonas sp. TaxID=1962908 RepID=UPI002ED8B0A3
MSIPVLLFASYADAFGTRELEVPVEAPCPVQTLVDTLRGMPGGDRLPPRVLVAVNQRLADTAAVLQPGDEVALIPPVAGG